MKLKLKFFKLFKNKLNSHNNFIAWNCTKKSLYEQTKRLTLDREHKILLSNDKSHFYKYINSRCSSIKSIGPIKSDNGAYLYSDLDKTNQLNK